MLIRKTKNSGDRRARLIMRQIANFSVFILVRLGINRLVNRMLPNACKPSYFSACNVADLEVIQN